MILLEAFWRECGCEGTELRQDGRLLLLRGGTCPVCVADAQLARQEYLTAQGLQLGLALSTSAPQEGQR